LVWFASGGGSGWLMCGALCGQVLAHSYKLKSKIDPDVEFETRRGRRAGVGR
jgi:hypothetical protein